MKKPATKFSASHYEVIAKIIRELPVEDQHMRKAMEDILGRGFAARSQVFDMYRWRLSCTPRKVIAPPTPATLTAEGHRPKKHAPAPISLPKIGR